MLAHLTGTVFHKLAWSWAVEAADGHEPLYLVAWHERRVCGVPPLPFVKSLLAGCVWRRLPLWLTRPAGAQIAEWVL